MTTLQTYKQSHQLKGSVLSSRLIITTHDKFNVLSGGHNERNDEPHWHVGVNTTGRLHTTTLVSIP